MGAGLCALAISERGHRRENLNRIKGLITVKRGCDGTVKFKSVAGGIPWARHAVAQHRGRRPLAMHIMNKELNSAVGPRLPLCLGLGHETSRWFAGVLPERLPGAEVAHALCGVTLLMFVCERFALLLSDLRGQ